jgi:hypothetical protein
VELREPAKLALLMPFVMAALRTGWFWKLFGPVSPSPVSLRSTELPPRSIPSAPLAKTALPTMVMPSVPTPNQTPFVPL